MPRPHIWFIDDDTPTALDIIEFWKSSADLPIKFRHFSTAKEAWEALLSGREVPFAIVVDGHLDSDDGELADGAQFIRQLRLQTDLIQPVILAFSGDDYALEDMESAGADAQFYKGNIAEVISYLRLQLSSTSFQNY